VPGGDDGKPPKGKWEWGNKSRSFVAETRSISRFVLRMTVRLGGIHHDSVAAGFGERQIEARMARQLPHVFI
jgi:hypothetical protein